MGGAYVLIENTTERLDGIGYPVEKGQKSIVVREPLQLLPGVNKVDAELWRRVREQKMVALKVQEGVFVEHMTVRALTELAPAEAKKLIKATFDAGLLAEWKKKDRRPPIQAELARQAEVLRKAAKDKRGKKSGDEDDEEEDGEEVGDGEEASAAPATPKGSVVKVRGTKVRIT